MANTKIEWANKVWNPVTGCTKVSAGCKNCYAETYAKRFWKKRKFTDVQCHNNKLDQPLHWKKPARIFVNSMSDLFHPDVPFEFIWEIYHIMMSKAPWHTYIVLTKRPERAKEFFDWWFSFPPHKPSDIIPIGEYKNIWLGVSVEDQKTADERIPLLLQTPAAVRFISAEPLLGKIELTDMQNRNYLHRATGRFNREKLNWVICGGESGKNARPMHPGWVRSLRDECKSANVPFFFKQWGEWLPDELGETVLYENGKTISRTKFITDEDTNSFFAIAISRYGKKKAGRLLDGTEYNEFPDFSRIITHNPQSQAGGCPRPPVC